MVRSVWLVPLGPAKRSGARFAVPKPVLLADPAPLFLDAGLALDPVVDVLGDAGDVLVVAVCLPQLGAVGGDVAGLVALVAGDGSQNLLLSRARYGGC